MRVLAAVAILAAAAFPAGAKDSGAALPANEGIAALIAGQREAARRAADEERIRRSAAPGQTQARPEGSVVDEAALSGTAALEFRRTLHDFAARARPFLEESINRSFRNPRPEPLSKPVCEAAAPRLAYLLRRNGMPADVVQAAAHTYVITSGPGGVIILDPSIRQFFGEEKAPPTMPAIFVGSLEELKALFAAHKKHAAEWHDVPGIWLKRAKIENARLAELEKAIRAEPREPSWAPLAAFR
jgi:hypothetical protein